MMQPVLRTHLHLQHLVPQVDQLLAPEPSSYKPRLTRSFPHVILVYLWMACYFMQLRCVCSAMKQHHHTKPPRKKDQEKTMLELCTPESPVYTGVSSPVHRSLRTSLRSGPRNQARDSQKAPPETCPEIDR